MIVSVSVVKIVFLCMYSSNVVFSSQTVQRTETDRQTRFYRKHHVHQYHQSALQAGEERQFLQGMRHLYLYIVYLCLAKSFSLTER